MNALLSVLGDEIPSPESRLETVVLKDQIRCLKGEEGRCDAMSLAQKLLGKGFGLTPSGDDFILGVVSIMDLFGSDVSVLRKIIDPYQNAFSRTMLLDALDGYYPQPLLSLLNCLSPSSSSSPAGEKYAQSSAASLLRLGHASGHDIISGMYWAVSRLV